MSLLNAARYSKTITWRDPDGYGVNRAYASGSLSVGGTWEALKNDVDHKAMQMALNLGFKPRSRWTRWFWVSR